MLVGLSVWLGSSRRFIERAVPHGAARSASLERSREPPATASRPIRGARVLSAQFALLSAPTQNPYPALLGGRDVDVPLVAVRVAHQCRCPSMYRVACIEIAVRCRAPERSRAAGAFSFRTVSHPQRRIQKHAPRAKYLQPHKQRSSLNPATRAVAVSYRTAPKRPTCSVPRQCERRSKPRIRVEGKPQAVSLIVDHYVIITPVKSA